MHQALRWALALAVAAALFGGIWWLCQAGLNNSRGDAITIAGVVVAVALAPLAWWAGRESPPSEQATAATTTDHPPITPTATSAPPPAPELIIGIDGHFIGGDEEAAKDFIYHALALPLADRRVDIRASALTDDTVRRQQVQNPTLMRQQVESYQVALTRLVRGAVHYYWKWDEAQLAEAVLELRSIELPAQYDRERWFVWPPSRPDDLVEVWLDATNVRSIQTASYRWPGTDELAQVEPKGVPSDEPIWLKQISPDIVWTRVAPAVVASHSAKHPLATEQTIVNISNWAMSNKEPTKLVKTRPSDQTTGYRPAPWNW